MGVKVATTCLHRTQPSLPHPQTIASTSLKRCSFSDGALTLKLDHPAPIGFPKYRPNPIRCTASMDSSPAFSDDEFTKQLQKLAMRLHKAEPDSNGKRVFDPLEPSDWPEIVKRRANSVDIPLSLRMIKRKKQWQEGFRAMGQSLAHCSVKKAFSNMVFIIRELQCYTIRETIMYNDLQAILTRVHTEMHASFVWLFQQVFSYTPTLMVYVMLLLANYSVYSMTAVVSPSQPPLETVSFLDSSPRDFSANSGKTASIGGGGGGDCRAVSSGTDGGGKFQSERTIVPDRREEEVRLWDSILDEAAKMKSEALDDETLKRFVSPVYAKAEVDSYVDYLRTELFYRMGLAEDPFNSLLLANYAQFLYLVVHDHDRAEEYFKRAVKVEPKDAEALSKYAGFLWQAKKDLWGAEETYLDAISVDPTNTYYASNYAHFLWSTGGEDTCFLLDAHEDE